MNGKPPIQYLPPNHVAAAAWIRWGYWWRVLLVGLGLYVAGILVLLLSHNPNLYPTIIMLGSFMIPVAYVSFFYERRHLSRLTLPTVSLGFLYGGLLGVFAASILEPLFIRNLSFLAAFQVGAIEEFVKILGVLVIARRRGHDSELDGLLLGAAAGMGFAALESMGYAFVALIQSGGSLSTTVIVMLIRGLFSPLGHGTWTAILVGVMFRESRAGHFRINRAVIGAYLTVVILHGLWDGLPSVVGAFTGSGLDVFISQSLIGLVGLVILWRRWREAVQLQISESMLQSAEDSEMIMDSRSD
jgi:RsiW-degrading membrane proteinase PrsW (M82 family)